MSKVQKSTALYSHPFSRAYWSDAAAELKDTKMLVVTALMIALRVALKPLAIPLGPQLSIQTAMLATALGAMIFGPVVAIPAAMISDTVGFMIYPTGDYFLPFMLTEIASTMLYALLLYRAKATPTRVMLARFFICFFVNVILQQFIYAWWYVYIGNPDKAKDQILGIMTVARIFKNLAMFPIESVVLTLFLKFLLPVTKRAKLTYGSAEEMKFDKKQVVTLVCLVLIGSVSAVGYMAYRYDTSSRSADYKAEERVAIQKEMAQVVLDNTDEWDDETVICVVDSAFRGLFQSETDYTLDTLWGYSKSGPGKDKYGSLIKVASCDIVKNEKTGNIESFEYSPVQ